MVITALLVIHIIYITSLSNHNSRIFEASWHNFGLLWTSCSELVAWRHELSLFLSLSFYFFWHRWCIPESSRLLNIFYQSVIGCWSFAFFWWELSDLEFVKSLLFIGQKSKLKGGDQHISSTIVIWNLKRYVVQL